MKLRWTKINTASRRDDIWQTYYRTCSITTAEGKFHVWEHSNMELSLEQAIYLIDHKMEIYWRDKRA